MRPCQLSKVIEARKADGSRYSMLLRPEQAARLLKLAFWAEDPVKEVRTTLRSCIREITGYPRGYKRPLSRAAYQSAERILQLYYDEALAAQNPTPYWVRCG